MRKIAVSRQSNILNDSSEKLITVERPPPIKQPVLKVPMKVLLTILPAPIYLGIKRPLSIFAGSTVPSYLAQILNYRTNVLRINLILLSVTFLVPFLVKFLFNRGSQKKLKSVLNYFVLYYCSGKVNKSAEVPRNTSM